MSSPGQVAINWAEKGPVACHKSQEGRQTVCGEHPLHSGTGCSEPPCFPSPVSSWCPRAVLLPNASSQKADVSASLTQDACHPLARGARERLSVKPSRQEAQGGLCASRKPGEGIGLFFLTGQ